MYEEFDRENMFGAIWDFPENLVDALKLGNEITLSQSYINIQNAVSYTHLTLPTICSV